MCDGFCAVEAVPSPKFQHQNAGEPLEVSVNCTDCPALGEPGDQVKAAVTEGATEIVCVENVEPSESPACRVTAYEPAVANTCDGFRSVDPVPSPNDQHQNVGVPLEVSVNCAGCPAVGEAGDQANAAETDVVPALTLIERVEWVALPLFPARRSTV